MTVRFTPAAAALAATTMLAVPALAQDRTYQVTIENLTSGQPFSPGLIVTHDARVSLFRNGHIPSAGIVAIAEDGNPGPALSAVDGLDGIFGVTAIDAPIGYQGNSGPFPDTANYLVDAPHGATHLSMAFMLICTNDGFSGLNSLKLTDRPVVRYGIAYDAGSEANDYASSSIVDPCGGIGPVALPADGNENSSATDGGRIRAHKAIGLNGDLTVEHRWQGPVVRITVTPVGS